MSSPSKKIAQLPPLNPSDPPPPTDLTAIAAMLNEAAQALLRFGKGQEAPESGDSAPHDDEREPSGPIEEGYSRGEFHEERGLAINWDCQAPFPICPFPAPDCAAAPAPALSAAQQTVQARQERFQARVYSAQALQVPR